MIAEKNIRHKARVKTVSGPKAVLSVMNQSACAACHARGACTLADMEEKEIELADGGRNLCPGQEVHIVLKESQGFKALLFGYLLPFIIVLLFLIIIFSLTNNEILAGLASLGVLIPYYITLYFFRGVLKKVFKFEVEEIS